MTDRLQEKVIHTGDSFLRHYIIHTDVTIRNFNQIESFELIKAFDNDMK